MFNALKEVDGSTPLLTVVVTTSQEWSEADLVAAVALAAN
jgi:hypothetical protein